MFEDKSIQIFFGVIFCIILIVFIKNIVGFLDQKRNYRAMQIVKNTSLRYKALIELNDSFHFCDIERIYIFSKNVKSKAQFDKFNYDKFFEEKDRKLMLVSKEIMDNVKKNEELLPHYNEQLDKLPLYAGISEAKMNKVTYKLYSKWERKLIEESTLHPVIEPKWECSCYYISPKGRNRYSSKRQYSLEEMKYYYDKNVEQEEKVCTKEYQRKLMTDSLRYDILKRDGFRCVICGRTANDGVKLHVDHIIPIAKGGKTVKENLRTLCEECNWGKRDKYDEDGVN